MEKNRPATRRRLTLVGIYETVAAAIGEGLAQLEVFSAGLEKN